MHLWMLCNHHGEIVQSLPLCSTHSPSLLIMPHFSPAPRPCQSQTCFVIMGFPVVLVAFLLLWLDALAKKKKKKNRGGKGLIGLFFHAHYRGKARQEREHRPACYSSHQGTA